MVVFMVRTISFTSRTSVRTLPAYDECHLEAIALFMDMIRVR